MGKSVVPVVNQSSVEHEPSFVQTVWGSSSRSPGRYATMGIEISNG